MKKVLCIVLVVAVLLAGGILAYVSFAGGETWTPTEGRTWTQADFDFLERGLSFREIVAVVGNPSGIDERFNWPRPYYALDKPNGTLVLEFLSWAGFPDRLNSRNLFAVEINYSEGGRNFRRTFTPGRTFTEADFDFLERGMSLEDVVAVVGEPNMPLLAGWPRPYYRLDIGTLTLWFNEQSGSPSEFVGRDLASITIRYSEGGSREIVLEE